MTTIGSGIQDFIFAPEQHLPLAAHRAQLEQVAAQRQAVANDDQPNPFSARRQQRKVGASEGENSNQQQNRATNQTQRAEPLFGRRADDQTKTKNIDQNRRATDFKNNRSAAPTNTPGLPSAGFLAQFIAQEVAPDNTRASANSNAGPGLFAATTQRYRATEEQTGPDVVLANDLDRV